MRTWPRTQCKLPPTALRRGISEALRHDETPTSVQIITATPYEDQP
jgi:hypothetical protein